MCGIGAPEYEKPFDYSDYEGGRQEQFKNVDIPIEKILGINCTGNLENYKPGMTFREVVFQCLHGSGITEDTVEFLVGNETKDIEMPHSPVPGIPKSRSKGGISASQYGEWFFIGNGQHRGIIAMYLLWQKEGHKGTLKNVSVTKIHSIK